MNTKRLWSEKFILTKLIPIIAFLISSIIHPTTPVQACNGYEVQPGDGLWRIAFNHNMTLRELIMLNSLSNFTIYPGQCLAVEPFALNSVGPNQIPTYESQNSISLAGINFEIDTIPAWGVVPRNNKWHQLIWSQKADNLVFSAHSDEAGQYLYALHLGDEISVTLNGVAQTFVVERNDTIITNFWANNGSWFYQKLRVRFFTCYDPNGELLGRQYVVAVLK